MGLIAAALYAAAMLLILVPLTIVEPMFPWLGRAMDAFVQDLDGMDFSDPFMFAFGMVMLILAIPTLFLATRIAGAGPVGRLSSVVGRLRWRWLLRCGVVALSLYAVVHSVSLVVAVAQGSSGPGVLDVPRALVLLVLTFTLVPLQCAAEEYLFRGYLLQAIGSWLRHPAFAILLPVPLFVLGHEYGLLGMTDVAVFAIAAGWLTWRTGGIEAALALHVVNNVSLFALGAVGLVDIGATEIGWGSLVVSVLMTTTFAFLVLRLAKRHGIQRTVSTTP